MEPRGSIRIQPTLQGLPCDLLALAWIGMVFARVSFAPMSRLCATDHIQKKGHVWIVHTSVSQNNTKTRALRPENEHRGAEGVGLAISDTVLVSSWLFFVTRWFVLFQGTHRRVALPAPRLPI